MAMEDVTVALLRDTWAAGPSLGWGHNDQTRKLEGVGVTASAHVPYRRRGCALNSRQDGSKRTDASRAARISLVAGWK